MNNESGFATLLINFLPFITQSVNFSLKYKYIHLFIVYYYDPIHIFLSKRLLILWE